MPPTLLPDSDAAKHLRTNLERVITDKHLSVPEFVKHLRDTDPEGRGLGENTIRRILAAEVAPRADTVRRLAAILDTTPAELLARPKRKSAAA